MKRESPDLLEELLIVEENRVFTVPLKTEGGTEHAEPHKKKARVPVSIREITTEPPPMLVITSEILAAGWETIT